MKLNDKYEEIKKKVADACDDCQNDDKATAILLSTTLRMVLELHQKVDMLMDTTATENFKRKIKM